ncbi:MAG: dihydropteroate synthase [Rikenellaceae bacterium]|nr:dihydropteroate synthase [Rikenellaceae bacterium]
MAIVNVTPDSFFAGSRLETDDDIRRCAGRALEDGAAILDVGGYSSRPGAPDVSPEEELARVRRGVGVIRKAYPEAVVSVDTFRASVAEGVVDEFGPCMVNDISAGDLDATITEVVARHDLPYVAMHMRGRPINMQEYASYDDIVSEVKTFFARKLLWLKEMGVRQVVIDPGFGFSKDTEQNYRLLGGLDELCSMGVPLLAGVSRKSMIYKPLGVTPAEALTGTTAIHWECLSKGALILRAHDVREAVDVVNLYEFYKSVNQ